MVPVTTKPYLNSVTFFKLQQGAPAFFLLINNQTSQHNNYPWKQESRAYRFYALCHDSVGIRTTNSNTFCFRHWSFTNKGGFE